MDRQRLLELAGITEAKYDEGQHLGTLENSFSVGENKEDAYRLASYLRRPPIGWHTNVKVVDGEYVVTLTINVDSKNLR